MSNLLARLRASRMVWRVCLTLPAMALMGSQALAEAAHGGEAGHKAGLPQLDTSTYASQLFWLVITFGALYYYMSRKALPLVAEVLTARQARIADDLSRAQALKAQAATTFEAYEKALADARSQAQSVVAQAAADIQATAKERESAFAAELTKRARGSEQQITAAKDQALAEIRSVAVDIAREVAEKVAGVKVDATQAEQAVASVEGGQA